MSTHYIKLKNPKIKLSIEEVEEIKKLQLPTYDKRFKYIDEDKEYSSIERFGIGTQEECLSKLNSFGELKKYFEVFAI